MGRKLAPAYVLQSAKPEEVDAWLIDRNERLARFEANCEDFQAKVGGKAVYRQSYEDLTIVGYETTSPRDAELPEGWRRERSYPYHVVPALRSKAGKAAWAALAEYRVEIPPPPGLPNLIWGANVMGQFWTEQVNGRWYATLTFIPREEGNKAADPERWFPAPLSRYYADHEAVEALLARAPEEEQA